MRWLRATFLPSSVFILAIAGMVVPLPAYVETPGRIVPLATCVDVEDEGATPVEGDYLLMTVSLLRASTFDAVIAAFDQEMTFVGQGQVVPPGVDSRLYFRQQREVFDLARNLAVAVGLQAAGKPAEITEGGARVIQTAPGTPAAEVLRPDDIITAVDGKKVSDAAQLRRIVSNGAAGEPLTLQVTRGDRALEVEVVPIQHGGSAMVGVVPGTAIDVTLPFEVDIASGSVGGPSAGLMIALTVYDKVLPDVDVAAGRTIAGTGTIDREGRVGPVGGAGLKVIAASKAGADVFLVPELNGPEARAGLPAGSDMQIVEVRTLDEARAWLERTADESADGAPLFEQCPYRERSRPAA